MSSDQAKEKRADTEEEERTPRDEARDSEQGPPEETPDPTEAEEAAPKKDPIRWITWGVLVFVLVVFVWYLFADRLTPCTDPGRVQALLLALASVVDLYTALGGGWQVREAAAPEER